MGEDWSMVVPPGAEGPRPTLAPGQVIGNRYEILQLLGEGGMGAVFKAMDRRLDRHVALKIIRPELANNPTVLRRFKQELLLARQVTHRNVIRIFDLGLADGLHFITMDFVEGRDLNAVLEQRKFTPEETVKIIRQVSDALDAAHSESVVHRDLKPHNIMLTDNGKVYVMDFGLARSAEASGLTRAGALLGTPTYMSPEQAKGTAVDTRSDLFSLGVIFYEMLTGDVPFKADTILGSLLKRTQEPAVPPAQVNPAIPAALSDIVMKCLATDPTERYQTGREVIADLDAFRGISAPSQTVLTAPRRIVTPRLPLLGDSEARKWITVSVALVALILVGVFAWGKLTTPASKGPHNPLSLLVADFNNATGDPVFNGTLEPTFITAMEGASFITAYNRVTARTIAPAVQPGATRLDEPVAKLVAIREGIGVVVSGSISREGGNYRLSARAIDGFSGKTIVDQQIGRLGKEGVLAAAAKLAARIRNALGDDTPESLQLAAAETYSAASLEAAHAYAEGQELHFAGKPEQAIQAYLRAVELDPNMGRAYAGLAAMYGNLGQPQQVDKYFQLAMARIDRMTDREKARTRATYYIERNDPAKAIEEYTRLVKEYPADSVGHAMLAVAFAMQRQMPRAVEEARRATEIYSKNVPHRNNLALAELYGGDFPAATREAQTVLQLNPSYPKAYVAIALSQLAQGQLTESADTYQRLAKISPRGASFAASGLADLAIYEGRLTEAAAILEKGIADDQANQNAGAQANKLLTLAQVQFARGQKSQAAQTLERAVAGRNEESVLFPAASLYIEMGQEAKARSLASQLGARLAPDPQAYAKLIEGLLNRGNPRQAVQSFQEAEKLLDTWIGRFELGRAYLAAQAFGDADAEFDHCLTRRGEALSLFLDETPTYHYLPAVYYYQGRARQGLKSPSAAEFYRSFIAIKKGGEDPLVADARRRLGN
jgi:serine/threonine protein kinase/tetratricopeptide (TPR) repeat protein